MTRIPDLATLRAAWWALRALRSVRQALAGGQVRDIVLPAPPRLPIAVGRGVEAALRRESRTCLERALVRQRWLLAHGQRRTVVIGVTPPSEGFSAHAWLLGENDPESLTFHELTRLEP